jgi:glycosyltransferase involved in cell wall biosynthesis
VLLHSYVTPEGLGGLLAAKASGAPALLMAEAEILRPRSLTRRMIRGLVFPPLLRLYDALLYIGTRSRSFYERYGVREQRLFFTPYCVDNSGFLADLDRHLAVRDATRREVGAGPGDRVLLFAGKLIARKRPVDVLRAVATLEPGRRPFVVFVGSGPLAPDVRDAAAALGVSGFAITGFKNADEIGRYYAAADAFVLPSAFETWGLVVNEAMVHSLPTIVSDRCGCAIDLVQDGVTGYRFPAGDCAALADRIALVFQDEGRRRAMGGRARAAIDGWSFVEVESGLRKALEKVG